MPGINPLPLRSFRPRSRRNKRHTPLKGKTMATTKATTRFIKVISDDFLDVTWYARVEGKDDVELLSIHIPDFPTNVSAYATARGFCDSLHDTGNNADGDPAAFTAALMTKKAAMLAGTVSMKGNGIPSTPTPIQFESTYMIRHNVKFETIRAKLAAMTADEITAFKKAERGHDKWATARAKMLQEKTVTAATDSDLDAMMANIERIKADRAKEQAAAK